MKTALSLFVAIVLMVVLGCDSTSKRSYSLSVENKSSQPMTVWLTKNGPPVEKVWASPEQLAVAGVDQGIAGVIIPAGKTAEIPSIEGHFHKNTDAVLRVYRGQLKFNEILAIGAGSPNRQDVTLKPGQSNIFIDVDGKVKTK